MKFLPSLWCTLALAVFLAPTGLGQDKGEDKDTSYYPLKVGNQWIYKAANGQKVVIRVAKEDKIGEVPCVKLESVTNGAVVKSEHLAAKKDGIYRYAGDGADLDPPVLVLKLPPKKGESWKVDTKLAGHTVRGTFHVVDDQAAVAVPAGKFKAVSVHTDDMRLDADLLKTTLWFAPGVGLVKQDLTYKDKQVSLELEKYEAAK
jgi:hypothetical protein